jgi:hypothetical protein
MPADRCERWVEFPGWNAVHCSTLQRPLCDRGRLCGALCPDASNRARPATRSRDRLRSEHPQPRRRTGVTRARVVHAPADSSLSRHSPSQLRVRLRLAAGRGYERSNREALAIGSRSVAISLARWSTKKQRERYAARSLSRRWLFPLQSMWKVPQARSVMERGRFQPLVVMFR